MYSVKLHSLSTRHTAATMDMEEEARTKDMRPKLFYNLFFVSIYSLMYGVLLEGR